jgi:hypothetical protein
MATFATQRELRAAFKELAKDLGLPPSRIPAHSGEGKMYPVDTRVAWCDWLDKLCKNGEISPELADRATLY